MGAIRDPRVTIVFEWQTGTRDNEKTHTVKLEIPPNNIALKFSKNVQKIVTTKGWVLNHGLQNLAVVTASGQAYHPMVRENAIAEGFNPSVAMSGLEYLNSAYVASGRLSSNPDLINTISSKLLQSIPNVGSDLSFFDQFFATINNRTEFLKLLSNQAVKIGTVDPDSQEVDFPEREVNSITQPNIESLRNTLSAGLFTVELTDTQFNQALNILNAMTQENVDISFRSFQELSTNVPNLSPIAIQFDQMLSTFKNQNQGLTFTKLDIVTRQPVTLDPSTATSLKRDPFILLKALSSARIVQQLKDQKLSLLDIFKPEEGTADDWIITIYMYWQDMVFRGHFEEFNMNQQAGYLGLWNWGFTFTAHDAWILKDNSIVPFTKAFDPGITQEESPGSAPDEYRNRNNPLERLLSRIKGGGSNIGGFF